MIAGAILDNADPRWLWVLAGLVGIVSVGVFMLLHRHQQAMAREAAAPGPGN
jgi:hypothetical protein